MPFRDPMQATKASHEWWQGQSGEGGLVKSQWRLWSRSERRKHTPALTAISTTLSDVPGDKRSGGDLVVQPWYKNKRRKPGFFRSCAACDQQPVLIRSLRWR